MLTGLTSVTFRDLSVDEIIDLCVNSGLDGIEWGSDVHLPVGDLALANEVADQCAKHGLRILSYGSYYRGGDVEEFYDVLKTAKALKTDMIRIWAGYHVDPDQISDEEFDILVSNVKKAAAAAKEEGICIGFEYHRRTMTQTKEGARRLLNALDLDNIYTYWQPNPDITFEEQLAEIDELQSRLAHYHVFAWEEGNVRYPLSHAIKKWQAYIAHGEKAPYHQKAAAILEFVRGDCTEQCKKDAATLKHDILLQK